MRSIFTGTKKCAGAKPHKGRSPTAVLRKPSPRRGRSTYNPVMRWKKHYGAPDMDGGWLYYYDLILIISASISYSLFIFRFSISFIFFFLYFFLIILHFLCSIFILYYFRNIYSNNLIKHNSYLVVVKSIPYLIQLFFLNESLFCQFINP